MCITAGQIQWTQDVTKALAMCKDRGDKRALKSLKKKQVKNCKLQVQKIIHFLCTLCDIEFRFCYKLEEVLIN